MRESAALALLLLFAALLGGCSALRVGYNQADKLVYYWLDGYASFDDAQQPRVRDAIAGFFAWHRRTQLADYAELLARIEAETRADTTPERVCGLWKEVRTRIDRAVDRTIPSIADLATTLKPEQLARIAERQAKATKEFRDDFMQSDPAKRHAESMQRAIDRYETLYGSLDSFQKERLEPLVSASPWDPELGFEELLRRQREVLELLRRVASGALDRETAQAQVRNYLKRVDPPPAEKYRQHNDRVIQHNCRAFAAVHNMTTPEQRQAAAKKLRGWADDLKVLASEPAE